MTRMPSPEASQTPADLEITGETRRGRRQGGWLAAANRRLGRMGAKQATAFLTGIAVVLAVGLNWSLSFTGYFDFNIQIFCAAFSVTVLTATPIIYYSQGIIRELSSSRRALTLMTEKLAVAFHDAERANEAKSKFMANMSHELRTPLNAILGFSDIMQRQLMGPLENARYRDYARDINASGNHLLSIINDILDLAKIESGQAVLEDECEFDALAAVDAACIMAGPLATRRNVELRIDLPAQAIMLRAIERMVRQIVLNILSNALKFTPSGGRVALRVERCANGSLAVAIADTGVGMSGDDIKVALTPFGQVHNEVCAGQTGTGLGLPLAKAMMDLHEGKLTIRSAPGEGTTVELTFPATRVRMEAAAKPIAVAQAS